VENFYAIILSGSVVVCEFNQRFQFMNTHIVLQCNKLCNILLNFLVLAISSSLFFRFSFGSTSYQRLHYEEFLYDNKNIMELVVEVIYMLD